MKLIKTFRVLATLLFLGIFLFLAIAMLVWPPIYVYRTIAWRESDAFDWQKFPAHPLQAAPAAYHFDAVPDQRVEELDVSSVKNLVFVRNGIDYGIPSEEWLKLFYEFANQF